MVRAPMQGVFQRIHDILIEDDVASPSQVGRPDFLLLGFLSGRQAVKGKVY